MFNAETIARLHDEANAKWHAGEPFSPAPDAFLSLVLSQHRANFDLWHEEDKARNPAAPASAIAEVKHSIDALNQRRNDLVEQLDEQLMQSAGCQNCDAPLHSETPGLIIDRLSILALKLYHTAEETHRPTAAQDHRHRNAARLEVLSSQRADLATCLDALWQDIVHGERRFKLYRQMKMYNDPDLNPVLYGGKQGPC